MKLYNTRNHKSLRGILRNQMTKPEIILWNHLKGKQLLGYKFRRQHGIGNYVVDFYCPEKRLVIEIDGGQHNKTKNIKYDRIRKEFFNSIWITEIRFWNNEVLSNIEGVISKIREQLIECQNSKKHTIY